jgi:hypothetical protein
MDNKQMSRKITADLKAAGVYFGSTGYGWSTQVRNGKAYAFAPVSPIMGSSLEEVIPTLEGKGYTVTRGTGWNTQSLSLSHPAFAAA